VERTVIHSQDPITVPLERAATRDSAFRPTYLQQVPDETVTIFPYVVHCKGDVGKSPPGRHSVKSSHGLPIVWTVREIARWSGHLCKLMTRSAKISLKSAQFLLKVTSYNELALYPTKAFNSSANWGMADKVSTARLIGRHTSFVVYTHTHMHFIT